MRRRVLLFFSRYQTHAEMMEMPRTLTQRVGLKSIVSVIIVFIVDAGTSFALRPRRYVPPARRSSCGIFLVALGFGANEIHLLWIFDRERIRHTRGLGEEFELVREAQHSSSLFDPLVQSP
jgi:hypothetical protein